MQQHALIGLCCALLWALLGTTSASSDIEGSSSPIRKVVHMLETVKTKIEVDRRMEQKSYDKYACWCEDLLARKAQDIRTSKALLQTLEAEVVQLSAESGAAGADVKHLGKEEAENIEAQKEARTFRQEEHTTYQSEKLESEESIGALEHALRALGKGRRDFLQTLQKDQVLDAAAEVREVLERPALTSRMSNSGLLAIRSFVERPEDSLRLSALSATQVGQSSLAQNPPASSQIVGVLQGLYDSFVGALEKASGEEAEHQKAFEELIKTKGTELKTLQDNLERRTAEAAVIKKDLVDRKTLQDQTKEKLAADQQLFTETESGCKMKAMDWGERSRLQLEELIGVRQAIEMLLNHNFTWTPPPHQNSTDERSTAFVQVGQIKHHWPTEAHNLARTRGHRIAYAQLRHLVARYHGTTLGRSALEARQGGGALGRVITDINRQIDELRAEEQEDIQHRDRCQAETNNNGNKKVDLERKAEVLVGKMQGMSDSGKELKKDLQQVERDVLDSKGEMKRQLEVRNQEQQELARVLQDNVATISLLEQVTAVLTKFYRDNKIPMTLAQRPSLLRKKIAKSSKSGKHSKKSAASGNPEYTIDPDKAPETTWDDEGADYKGAGLASSNAIVAIQIIKEDLEKEVQTLRKEEKETQKDYEEEVKTMTEAHEALKEKKASITKQAAELGVKLDNSEQRLAEVKEDLTQAEEQAKLLDTSCEWVRLGYFDSRYKKRKAEIDGLMEAREHLSRAADGDAAPVDEDEEDRDADELEEESEEPEDSS